MNKKNYFLIATACIALSLFTVACSSPAPEETVAPEEVATPPAQEPDMAAIKAEIQDLEDAWGAADTAGDITSLMAFYADDAVSMGSGAPVAVGKAAIQKEFESSMAKRPAGQTITFEVLDIFGDENTITEVGKTTRKDASGKVVSSGSYMAIWEKRDGKYVCVRDISNNDSKEN
ncbi:DUF4440 domain-containing protein [Aquiflexum sp. LQ15W]|uniref:YybH family protein n=1 Tax=Cognataquiflexum nitidum TaxID=2922272 RepID=UPI001F136169|nr:DUF4440 domain-containing protein [Cognataquiflexum nitidum]MCH6198252.1 DUF4440 domain-containing protein [Cognataquiflexum nitidum]